LVEKNMSLASLKIRNKLAIVVGLLALPLVLMSWLFIQQSFKDIDFAIKEIAGRTYLGGTWPVLRDLAAARAMPGSPVSQPASNLAALGATYDDGLDIGSAGREMRDLLAKLGWPPKPELMEAQAETTIGGARTLITKIADGSNLTLDPDLDSYYVMDAATTKLPEAVDKIAALTALARAYKARAELSDDDKAAPIVLIGLFKAAAEGAAASIESAAKGNASGDVRRRLEAPTKAFADTAERFSAEAMKVVVAMREDGKRRTTDLTGLTARAGEALNAADVLWRQSADQLDALLRARVDGFRTRLMTMLGLSGVIVAFALFVVWLIARAITKPVAAMQRTMQALAQGDLDADLPAKGRADEIGQMSDMLYELRDGLAEARRLQAEQRTQEIRTAEEKAAAHEREQAERRAAERRQELATKAAMHQLMREFQTAIGGVIDTVASAATELEASAATLTSAADSTRHRAEAVASASEEASTNVQTVAAATGQLTSSVNEISRQVQASNDIARHAVAQAEKTDTSVSQLSEAAARIGDVVKLITAIAEQTNLLALNATIEAARAGEAGKGFAVVAQEVKALASQTARATGDISTQIANMQAATQDSVKAIKEIGSTIGRISEISGAIASAVEEQGAATQEITRNVEQAAQATGDVSANIVEVSHHASETGAASAQMLSSAQSLSVEGNRLKREMEKFLETIRTGVADRREVEDPNFAGPDRRANRRQAAA
jgi:methyl-accepting chemotaxis protein